MQPNTKGTNIHETFQFSQELVFQFVLWEEYDRNGKGTGRPCSRKPRHCFLVKKKVWGGQ